MNVVIFMNNSKLRYKAHVIVDWLMMFDGATVWEKFQREMGKFQKVDRGEDGISNCLVCRAKAHLGAPMGGQVKRSRAEWTADSGSRSLLAPVSCLNTIHHRAHS